jgi:hypothetical protein
MTAKLNISTARYVRSHGKQPRGFGSWAFIVNGEPVFIGYSTSYGRAKELIHEHLLANRILVGTAVIEVAP